MRSALSSFQQTLAPEAARLLDQSIAEAGRRSHSETTALHVAAAALACPSGFLRQACIKSHPNSSHPLLCRALELCFSVALNRLPTTQSTASPVDPPFSKALMAALGRSGYRRIELERLIVNILDDPSVTKVVREATFSGPAIKATIEQRRKLHLNATAKQQHTNDNDVKRILNILLRRKKKNLIVVGEFEPEATIKELIRKIEIHELQDPVFASAHVIHLENELPGDKTHIPARLRELGDLIEMRIGSSGCGGVIVDLGDLKWLVEHSVGGVLGNNMQQLTFSEAAGAAVKEMGRWVSKFGRLWLLGSTNYDTYLRCQVYHPTMENELDLQAVTLNTRDSASLPGIFPRKYEVFLSFRGEDTRASFTSHLYASLQNAGVNVFKDDESLQMGDNISPSLLQAIEQSRISVVVFSRNYAESRWCMKELKRIMDCQRTIGQVVVPVFYDVDPSEVRHQTGEFGKAFQNLLNRILKEEDEVALLSNNAVGEDEVELEYVLRRILTEKEDVLGWREALREAAGISGVVVLNSRNEIEAIKNIVENVTRFLDKEDLFVADNPVGVESRVQDMIQLLEHKLSNDVLLLGIWGMGGIGKTTITKAIYNKIGQSFEGRSFLACIREVWGQDVGRVNLQEQLLSDIYKETKTKIPNVESGKTILKERLRHKRVLLVLDDVNELDQLNALCGSREWFGSGSRIIITTRDKHIIRGNRVDKVHIIKGMDESESIELFSWHAFKQASPREEFIELSRNVVAYSGGLPLALQVLGCYLFDMEVTEWESVLEKLKRIPNDQIHKKLKISYDGLSDDTEREIFLDIACFFIGMDKNDVIIILNGCGLFAENGIRVLVERSLITVDDKNKLGMHDLLRDMGREIIRSKSPKKLEKRSRLWFHEDVLDVLSKEMGTKAIEGLALKLPRTNIKRLSTKAFKKMKKLKLLQLASVQLVGEFKYLSRDLRWLCWHGFPLPCIPTNFYQESLVSIELENSNVKLVWKEAQMMENLKILNLSHSHYLTQTPDFSNLPNLEKLILKDCPRLSKVSNTIGHLYKVLLINFQDCISLCNLPRSIYKLKSLKTLILSGCVMIDKLEEDMEQMESLTALVADKTAITKVPFSIVRSKSIGYISLCGYEGFTHHVFPSIIWSWISPTNRFSSRVQTFAGMSSLVSLDLGNSSSHYLSSISKDFPKLQSLWIECKSECQLSQDAKSILDALCATDCEELELTATTTQMPNMKDFTLVECNSQVHISGSKNSIRSLLIEMGRSCQVTHILKQSILQNTTTSDCLLPGNSYPNWLTFNNIGSSVIFEIPQVNGRNLKTMMCHVHYSSLDNIRSDGLKNLLVINHTKTTIQLYKKDAIVSFEDEEWQRVLSNIEPGNKVEVIVVFGKRLIVYKTTVYLIYAPMDQKMEHCPSPNKNVHVSTGDENACAVSCISGQVESSDDFMQKQKRRKVDVKQMKKECLSEN